MTNWDTLWASYSSRGATVEKAPSQSSWPNSETQTLRVPKVLTNQLIKLARRLDNGEAIAAVKTKVSSLEKLTEARRLRSKDGIQAQAFLKRQRAAQGSIDKILWAIDESQLTTDDLA